jgi:hypothetical protein
MSKQSESATKAASKIYAVRINQMRPAPAGICQRSRFSKAWGDEIARNLDPDQIGLPVLNHRGGVFWIVDGQHRIYALKTHGFTDDKDTWLCEVFENLTDAEMADLFLTRNNGKHVTPFDKFKVACTAERPIEMAILRIVEAHGLKVSRAYQEGCIGAVTALRRVLGRAGDMGEIVLGRTIRTLRDAYASQPIAFDGYLIEGLGLVYARYDKADEKLMVRQLAGVQRGAPGVLQRAQAQRERTGNHKVQCIAAVIVDIYNKGASGRQRLAAWWKVADAA